jgi:enoyl-[acyl-carrier protein] reductase II
VRDLPRDLPTPQSPRSYFCALQAKWRKFSLSDGLRNRIMREWERRDAPPPYEVVSESELPVIGQARLYGQEFPMKRFCGFPPTPEFTGDLEEMSLLAGESVGQTRQLMSAASIIDEMMSDAEAVIRKRLGSIVVG